MMLLVPLTGVPTARVRRHPAHDFADNEIVFDAYSFNDRLPGVIEAFFYLDDPECNERKCKGPSRRAHASFLKKYPSSRTPLLELDPRNAERLFSDAPPPPPSTSIGDAGSAPGGAGVLSESDIRCMRCPLCCRERA